MLPQIAIFLSTNISAEYGNTISTKYITIHPAPSTPIMKKISTPKHNTNPHFSSPLMYATPNFKKVFQKQEANQ
ncbi:MAG: hypothetical protein ACI4AI_02750 [Paludibacteraceae bacterium]